MIMMIHKLIVLTGLIGSTIGNDLDYDGKKRAALAGIWFVCSFFISFLYFIDYSLTVKHHLLHKIMNIRRELFDDSICDYSSVSELINSELKEDPVDPYFLLNGVAPTHAVCLASTDICTTTIYTDVDWTAEDPLAKAKRQRRGRKLQKLLVRINGRA